MKRFLAVGALLAALASALFVARAGAIVGGKADTVHTGVGYVAFYDRDGFVLWTCTGDLVSTRVLLTAGHCAGAYDTSSALGVMRTPALAQVWFDDSVSVGSGYQRGHSCKEQGKVGFPCTGGDSYGVPVPHPQFVGSHADGVSHDLGVVVLMKQQNRRKVLDLAPVGTLNAPALRETPVTIVGYGLQSPPVPGLPTTDGRRMQGTVTFVRPEDGTAPDDELWFADFTNAPPGAEACSGDSGGPVLDRSGDIVAVISLVDPQDGFCAGDAFHYRTDTLEAKSFLARFGVRVPTGDNRDRDDGGHGGGGDHRKHGRDFNRD